jgi:E3 SUMO-protein ligase PIAS1
VRVNGTLLGANLKGLKKKPGTAPPPDLGKSVRLAMATSNRVEIVYVNSQQPAIPKVCLPSVWQATTSADLGQEILFGRYASRDYNRRSVG